MEIMSKETEVRPNTISEVKVDVTFRKIKKNVICFYIWRIEEDRLEAEAKDKYGTFVDDSAYIVYAASPAGGHVNQDTITRETKCITLERSIHFWLGEKVSEQKRSNVAHKIQELDSYFGNVATEYRETQNNESARFMSYFKKGITILSGALVGSLDVRRLYQVRGRKYLRCTEMDSISWEFFGADYVMLLKVDMQLFIWFGRSSSKMERRNAMEWASKKFSLSPADVVVVDDGYEQSMPEPYKTVWNSVLPLNQRIVSQNSVLAEKPPVNKMKIYKCGYKGGRLHLDQLDLVIPTKDDLKDSTACYVLDAMTHGVWLWVGNQAPHQDNISAMGNGRAFVKKKKYPYTTPVVRVVEGHEPIEFTRLFPKWHHEWHDSINTFKPVTNVLGKLDSMTLSQRPKLAADTQLIDDGSGERIIYCITPDHAVEFPQKKLVMFSTNNCYVVEYSVVIPTANPTDTESVGVQSIIYQWNGSEATREAVLKCEAFAKTCFEKFTDKVMYVQMSEFDETPHFLQIFDGKLIILLGDKSLQRNGNGLTNNNSNMNMQHFVLKISGDASYNAKAVEVYPMSSMNSRECYVVKTNHVWVWCGQSSTGDAREVAKSFGALLGEYTLVVEGKEPIEFWHSVNSNGNRSPPPSSSSSSSSSSGVGSHNHMSSNGSLQNGRRSPVNGSLYLSPQTPKTRPQAQLYLIWAQRGKFCTQEIIAYTQSDLAPESVYILDAGIVCYVWLGQQATSFEKQHYLELAQHYLESVPIARRPTTAIAVIRQGDEPNVFKGFFDNWNSNFWNNFVSYEEKRQMIGMNTEHAIINGKSSISGDSGSSPLPPALLNINRDFDGHQKYPITTLQQERDLLPPEVNPLNREVHLTHDDFVSLFNMSFWEFDELPKWKKQELKKKHKLF